MLTNDATKTCKKCGKLLPLSAFFMKHGAKMAECKSCNRATQSESVNRHRQARVQYRREAILFGASKTCVRCKKEKPYSEFHSNSTQANGTQPACKECRRKREVGNRKGGYRCLCGAAKRRGIAVEISLTEYVAMLLGAVCHFCQGELPPMGGALDRCDNSIGYLISNCVPCCRSCNIVKGERFSYEEMMRLAPTLKSIRESRAMNLASEQTGAMRGDAA